MNIRCIYLLFFVGIISVGCRSHLKSFSPEVSVADPICGRESYWEWAGNPENIRIVRIAALRGDRNAVERLVYHYGITRDTDALVLWLTVGVCIGIDDMRENLDALVDCDGSIRPAMPADQVLDSAFSPFK